MGFSTSAAMGIFGIACFTIIGIAVGDVLPVLSDTYASLRDMKDRSVEQMQTDITILGVTTSANSSNYDHNVSIQNTGSTTLETQWFTVLINGVSVSFTSSSTYLVPEQTSTIYVYNLAGSGPTQVKITTENGISDDYSYII